jgi:hypothetical protein
LDKRYVVNRENAIVSDPALTVHAVTAPASPGLTSRRVNMLIDCDTCVVRGPACGDCVISVLLGAPPAGVDLDDAERRALAVLAGAGMVPQLRLVRPGDPVPAERQAGRPTDRYRGRRAG